MVRKFLHALLNTLQSKVALNCDSLQCIVPANAGRWFIATIIKSVSTANKEVPCYLKNKTNKTWDFRISPDRLFPREHHKDHNLWSTKPGNSTNSNMFDTYFLLTVLEGIRWPLSWGFTDSMIDTNCRYYCFVIYKEQCDMHCMWLEGSHIIFRFLLLLLVPS